MLNIISYKYFGSKRFYQSVAALALPVMAQVFIQSLVTLIDQFMVAGLGDIKMSGVNVSGQILYLFQALINSVCTTGGIFLSQFFGAQNNRGMKQSFLFKLILSCFCIALQMFCCIFLPQRLLSLMLLNNRDASAILQYGTKYMFLMSFSCVPCTLCTVIASSLREIGKVKPPLILAISATSLNTFLDWVLIYGKFGLPALEIRGAAIATILSLYAELIAFIIYLFIKKPPFLLCNLQEISPDLHLFTKLLKKSFTIITSEMILMVSGTLMTALFNSRGGADVVSGMSASNTLANLFFVIFSGINTAISVLLGKTLGHGELSKARSLKDKLMMTAFLFGFTAMIFCLSSRALIPLVFRHLSTDAQTICHQMVTGIAYFLPLMTCVNAQYAVSRAGGDTLSLLFIDGSTTILLLLAVILFTAKFTALTAVAMYMICRCVDFVRFLLAGFLLKKERWLKNLTANQPT